MEIEFDVNIKASDLYDYLLCHTYGKAQGLIGSAVGALLIICFLAEGHFIFLLAGIVILLYLPWTLYLKSRQQALNKCFQSPLHYKLTEEGIEVSQGDTKELQTWEQMHKACSTPKSLFVYTSPVSACIFPKRELGEKKIKVIEMISTHMEPKKVKIKD